VLTVQSTISGTNFSASNLTAGGCTTCGNELAVFQTIFNGGGISEFVKNYIASRGTSTAGQYNDYGLSNRFQDGRNVRFGVRFTF
jgi:hypothetical protein